MELNNVYNFKNPVKHFLNIDNMTLPEDIDNYDINKLEWSAPISFRIYKDVDKFRTLKMPNILNFVAAYYYYRNMPNFTDIQSMDIHKRLSANMDTGDFSAGAYDSQLDEDFNNLCIYDNLIRLDVKEYYGRIYTHYIDFSGHEERYISNMNLGATNGLLMGNYLSLYYAEKNLTSISTDIANMFQEQNIKCEFSYFSDDFYFFCNKEDNEKIIKVFDKVLEKYELERSNKKEIWNYETFNNFNVVARYWKKLVAHCNIRYKEDRDDNKLYFINQIVYRMSKLENEKIKKVFINNVFKIKYFRELNLENFQVKKYDYHQLCFIMKYSPESMLYVSDRFAEMESFENQKMYKFFDVRFGESLKNDYYNEVQLYYFYAISLFEFDDILVKYKDIVVESNNQILISYYLKKGIFDSAQIDCLKSNLDENKWLQNYHLILYCQDLYTNLDVSIERYLIPKKIYNLSQAKQSTQKKKMVYLEFYKKNLNEKRAIIRNISDVKLEIINYLELRIKESGNAFDLDE